MEFHQLTSKSVRACVLLPPFGQEFRSETALIVLILLLFLDSCTLNTSALPRCSCLLHRLFITCLWPLVRWKWKQLFWSPASVWLPWACYAAASPALLPDYQPLTVAAAPGHQRFWLLASPPVQYHEPPPPTPSRLVLILLCIPVDVEVLCLLRCRTYLLCWINPNH